jgi:hypothetical protein
MTATDHLAHRLGRALALAGRRSLGIVLLVVAIGLSTCQALHATAPDVMAPAIDELRGLTSAVAPAATLPRSGAGRTL